MFVCHCVFTVTYAARLAKSFCSLPSAGLAVKGTLTCCQEEPGIKVPTVVSG